MGRTLPGLPAIATVVALACATSAGAEPARAAAPAIEDARNAMAHVYERLAAAERREPGATVRITVYADSINGWDGVTSELRHALQARFGDAGRGFVHIAPGWQYQHHRDVRWTYSSDWRTHVVNRGQGPGGRYGLGGVMAADGSRRSSATFATATEGPSGRAVSRFRLFYQAFPGAGSVTLAVDGGAPVEVDASASAVEDRVHEIAVADGPHALAVGVGRPNVRLYGVVMERDRPGVVVDNVALVGARVARLLLLDAAHWRRQIELRAPDLLVFWLGGNNVTSRGWTRDAFVRDYGRAVANARAGRPRASCLIASIPDIGERETGASYARVPEVVAAQREVARAQRCAFLDVYQAMGGAGAASRWARSDPRLTTPDFRHLTPAGAMRMGQIFTEAIVAGYEARAH